jgi:hypothetical protein
LIITEPRHRRFSPCQLLERTVNIGWLPNIPALASVMKNTSQLPLRPLRKKAIVVIQREALGMDGIYCDEVLRSIQGVREGEDIMIWNLSEGNLIDQPVANGMGSLPAVPHFITPDFRIMVGNWGCSTAIPWGLGAEDILIQQFPNYRDPLSGNIPAGKGGAAVATFG